MLTGELHSGLIVDSLINIYFCCKIKPNATNRHKFSIKTEIFALCHQF